MPILTLLLQANIRNFFGGEHFKYFITPIGPGGATVELFATYSTQGVLFCPQCRHSTSPAHQLHYFPAPRVRNLLNQNTRKHRHVAVPGASLQWNMRVDNSVGI